MTILWSILGRKKLFVGKCKWLSDLSRDGRTFLTFIEYWHTQAVTRAVMQKQYGPVPDGHTCEQLIGRYNTNLHCCMKTQQR
jgi:hypothetical protein